MTPTSNPRSTSGRKPKVRHPYSKASLTTNFDEVEPIYGSPQFHSLDGRSSSFQKESSDSLGMSDTMRRKYARGEFENDKILRGHI